MIYHGVNIGHGYVKYITLDEHGEERTLNPFPAMIAPARGSISALDEAPTTELDGNLYWVGEEARLSPYPTTILAQERLTNPVFIPVLVRSAIQRMGLQNNPGLCVTCLPATWTQDRGKCQALGQQLRIGAGNEFYTRIRVIPEPVAMLCAVALNNKGATTNNELIHGTVGVVDLGHHTVNLAAVNNIQLVDGSLYTWNLGSARPLAQIASSLSAHFERELSLHDVDLIIRNQAITIRGTTYPLPKNWENSLIENGHAIATKMQEVWGSGASLDTILIGGGGASLEHVVQGIRSHFPHARRLQDPQQAIALGCARFARRMSERSNA